MASQSLLAVCYGIEMRTSRHCKLKQCYEIHNIFSLKVSFLFQITRHVVNLCSRLAKQKMSFCLQVLFVMFSMSKLHSLQQRCLMELLITISPAIDWFELGLWAQGTFHSKTSAIIPTKFMSLVPISLPQSFASNIVFFKSRVRVIVYQILKKCS